MKKFNYILKILFVLLVVVSLCLNSTFAASDIYNYFVNSKANDLDAYTLGNMVYTILMWIGWTIAIIVVLTTAIQFLTASSQKRAVLKEKLWLIILGCAVLVGGIPLLRVIQTIINDFRASFVDLL